MKKFLMTSIFIPLYILSALLFPSSVSFAQSYYDVKKAERLVSSNEYMRVINDTTPFFSDYEGKNLLFYLPYTYYVKIIEKGEILSQVEYGGGRLVPIDGYVPTDMLFSDNLAVEKAYPEITVRTLETASLYSDSNCNVRSQYVFADRTAVYYGTLSVSDSVHLIYVSYNDRLGYLKESCVQPFSLPNHPNELTFIEQPTEEPPADQSTEENTSTLTSLRIIIIGCLVLAGITALFVAARHKPTGQERTNYYDENDYE